jgi:hypothetical protein
LSRSRCRKTTAAVKPARISPQKRIDPSSELQSETMLTQTGVDRLPTWATYEMLKSWVRRA